MDDQRGRLPLLDVADRRVAVEARHVGVRVLAAHFQVPPGRVVGGAGELGHRADAGMRDQAAEALGLGADPVGHVATEAAAHCHDARAVHVGALRQRIGDRHQVLEALVAPDIAPDALHELLAEAGGAARVRLHHGVALRHCEQRVPAPVPAVTAHADGATVDPQQGRCMGRAARPRDPALDQRAVGRGGDNALGLGPGVRWCEARQARQRDRRGGCAAIEQHALRCIENRRVDGCHAAIGQRRHAAVAAARGTGRQRREVALQRIDRVDGNQPVVVGGDQQLLAVGAPVRQRRPAIPALGQRARLAAGNVDQRQQRARRGLGRAGRANRRDLRAIGRKQCALGAADRRLRQQAALAAVEVDQQQLAVELAVVAGQRTADDDALAVGADVQMRLDREFALRLRGQVDPIAARGIADDQVGIGELGVLVQPVVPVPHRLAREAAQARSLLCALGGGFALLVVRDAGQHRREQRHAVSARRELERRHAEWFVGQLARLAAVGWQQPDLHALVGRVVGLALVRLPIRQETQRAVVPEAGRAVLAVTARQLHGGAAVGRHFPEVGYVARAVLVEALHRHGQPASVGRGGQCADPLERDVLFDRIGCAHGCLATVGWVSGGCRDRRRSSGQGRALMARWPMSVRYWAPSKPTCATAS